MLATGQLTKFRSKYEGFWAADPDEPAHLRANQEAPKDYPEYVMAASKQGYYADDLILSALADRLKAPIIVFAWIPQRQSWERSVVSSDFQPNGQAVVQKKGTASIVMMQLDHHYMSLCQEGDTDCVPEAWLKKTEVKPRQLYRAGGDGAGSRSSKTAGSSRLKLSLASVLSLPDDVTSKASGVASPAARSSSSKTQSKEKGSTSVLSLALSSGNAPARRKPCNKDTAFVLSLPLSSKLSQKVKSDQTQTGSVTGIPPGSARKPYPRLRSSRLSASMIWQPLWSV